MADSLTAPASYLMLPRHTKISSSALRTASKSPMTSPDRRCCSTSRGQRGVGGGSRCRHPGDQCRCCRPVLLMPRSARACGEKEEGVAPLISMTGRHSTRRTAGGLSPQHGACKRRLHPLHPQAAPSPSTVMAAAAVAVQPVLPRPVPLLAACPRVGVHPLLRQRQQLRRVR